MTAKGTVAKPKRQAERRQASEQKILDAFERLLRQGGLESIGINAVVQEAGVGKGLLYDYFGGLEGLVEAWARTRKIAPDPEEIIGEPLKSFRTKAAPQQIAQVHTHYAGMLRDSPVALRLMAEELNKPGTLRDALGALRMQIGASHEKVFTDLSPLRTEDDFALCMVFLAAANYLALRSKTSPNFNGIDLSSEAGWNRAMGLFERIANRMSPPG